MVEELGWVYELSRCNAGESNWVWLCVWKMLKTVGESPLSIDCLAELTLADACVVVVELV